MRWGTLYYVCETCGACDSGIQWNRAYLEIMTETICHQAVCACDGNHQGSKCKTKECGGNVVLTVRDNYGIVTRVGYEVIQ